MKTIFTILVLSFLFWGCQSDTKQKENNEQNKKEITETNEKKNKDFAAQIIGTWKLVDVKFSKGIPENQKQEFKEEMLKEASEVTYNQDNTYINKNTLNGSEIIIKGTYRIEGNQLKIKESIEGSEQEQIIEIEIIDDKMNYTMQFDDIEMFLLFRKQ